MIKKVIAAAFAALVMTQVGCTATAPITSPGTAAAIPMPRYQAAKAVIHMQSTTLPPGNYELWFVQDSGVVRQQRMVDLDQHGRIMSLAVVVSEGMTIVSLFKNGALFWERTVELVPGDNVITVNALGQ